MPGDPSVRTDLSTMGSLSTLALGDTALSAPIRGYRFTVNFNGLPTASFKSVEGFSIEVATTEYREGSFGRLTNRKLPGLVTFNDITLTKGLYVNMDIYDFFASFLEGFNVKPLDGTIITYNNASEPTAAWKILSAWPTRYEPGGLNADSSDVIIETLVLANEGVFRIPADQASSGA